MASARKQIRVQDEGVSERPASNGGLPLVMSALRTRRSSRLQRAALLCGPVLFVAILLSDRPASLSQEAWNTAAVAALMAVWWATEALPLAVTALVPLALFPLLAIGTIQDVAPTYTNAAFFLLLGGFLLALAMQRWDLHRRVALSVLVHVGDRPAAIAGGFMLATAFLSMWISNTATTLMMVPIALSVASIVEPASESEKTKGEFTSALLLCIAYSASIGGVGTLVGTPPNVLLAGYLESTYGYQLDFATWLLIGLPQVCLMLPLAWILLTRVIFRLATSRNPKASSQIRTSLRELGSMRPAARRTTFVLATVALCWTTRPLLGAVPGLSGLSDTGVAILGAVALFVISSGEGDALLNWEWAKRVPWDVLLLYGGALALAAAISNTGLAGWLGEMLSFSSNWPLIALMFLVVLAVKSLTELVHNSAALAAFLPVLGSLSQNGDFELLWLAVPAGIAASYAFMLPVATPPNAVVYGSGAVPLHHMVRAGLLLNVVSLILTPLASVFSLWLLNL